MSQLRQRRRDCLQQWGIPVSFLLLALLTEQHAQALSFGKVRTTRRGTDAFTLNVAVVPMLDDNEFMPEKGPERESTNEILNKMQQKYSPVWIDEAYCNEIDRMDCETDQRIEQKQSQIRSRYFASTTDTYVSKDSSTNRVQIPLQKSYGSTIEATSKVVFGITVAEVSPGRILSNRRLDLDSMYTEIVDNGIEEERLLQNLHGNYRGLIVTSIIPDSPLALAGVKVGDMILAISATIGDNVWPTSTLQGIQSALSSRKMTSGSVTIEFRPSATTISTTSTSITESSSSSSSTSSLPYSTLVIPNSNTTPATAFDSSTSEQNSKLNVVATTQQYELTLSRPLGFQIGENSDGYVVVTGLNDKIVSNLVRHAVRIGDRIVAIDTSFGDKLWPISTVEGAISAVTGRLPGQPVTIRFERPTQEDQAVDASLTNSKSSIQESTVATLETSLLATSASSSLDVAFPDTKSSAATDTVVATPLTQKELIKRCRDVLRRYSIKQQEDISLASSNVATGTTTTAAAYNVGNKRTVGAVSQLTSLVADKVVDALASAAATVDSLTLNMIMNAYIQSQKPLSAIRVFEAATGFAGDGSTNPAIGATTIVGKTTGYRISPSESSLNIFTGTSLLSAHAALGDCKSVACVIAALEGRSGEIDFFDETTKNRDILEVAPWPWTGTFGSIQTDTVCYNTAIAAAERIGGPGALSMAKELFDRMSDPVAVSIKGKQSAVATATNEPPTKLGPLRNEATYNTMMSALCKAGRSDDALKMFNQMQRASLRPDKYTYTILIRACDNENDIKELLYAMTERGIQPDIVTYNTIIQLLCRKRQLTQATKVVTEMEARGIAPDSRTYGTLMSGLLQAGKPSSCLTLFESAYSNSRTLALTENVYLYTTAITAASMLNNHERALDLVTRMTASGLKPTLQTLTAVIGACLASKKPALAAQLYQKIASPDGYAMSQGIRAYYESGDLELALTTIATQRRGSRILTGPQMMQLYQGMLSASLRSKNYSMGQRIIHDLLEKGYIPSKSILNAMFDAMNLSTRRTGLLVDSDDEDKQRFRFLLTVLDQLRARNLPIESSLYITTLLTGAQLGGLPRKIASLLSRAKTNNGQTQESIFYSLNSPKAFNEGPEALKLNGWVDLLEKYDSLPKESLSLTQLPHLPVRVSSKDVAHVLRVEQSVSYNNRRNTQRGILQK
jgi:pentatricopeptide repeat protein